MERGEKGNAEKVIFVTRVIDSEKREEQKLLAISYSDELTSLYNRRAFDNDLASLKKNKLHQDLTIISIDVNGLKTTNDTLGHKAGDELICGTASALNDVFTAIGKGYRTGGDEFFAIIVASKERVDQLIEIYRNTLSAFVGEYINGISVSVGYARASEDKTLNIDKLCLLADSRMYDDKNKYYLEHNIDRRKH